MATRRHMKLEEAQAILLASERKFVVYPGTPCVGELMDESGTVITYKTLGTDVDTAMINMAGYIEWMQNTGLEVL
jgi:hypothetical protein